MNEQVLNDGVARQFLLGQLPPEEQGRIEELAFQDPDTFAFLQAAEDDLVDEFLYNELSSDEKQLFRTHFLTKPGRRQNVRIARALKQYLEEDDVPVVETVVAADRRKPSLFQWFRLGALTAPLVIAAILLTSSAVIWVAVKMSKGDGPQQAVLHPSPTPTPSSSPVASPLPSASPSQTHEEKPSPTPRQSTEPVFAIALVPTANVRSDSDVTKLVRQNGPISFELPVISVTPYRSYQAVLETGGRTIRTWSNLKTRQLQSGTGIQLTIQPGQLAGAQRYRIALNGVSANGQTQTVHNYHFELSQ